jgi:hypothetical protein
MPAKDIYHDIAKNALIKDGWAVTHDPLILRWGTTDVYVDLGAEHGIAADLEQYGVSKDCIVLGFHAPDLRKYTGYAA